MRRISLDAFARLVSQLAEQAMLESVDYAEALTGRLGQELDADTQENVVWEMQRLVLFALFDACAEFAQDQEIDFATAMRTLSTALLDQYVVTLRELEVDEEEIESSRIQTQARLAEYDQALRQRGNGGPAMNFSRVAAKYFFGPGLSMSLFDQFGEFAVSELGVYSLYGTQLKNFRKKFATLQLASDAA